MDRPRDEDFCRSGYRIRFGDDGTPHAEFFSEPLQPTSAITNMTYDPSGSGPIPTIVYSHISPPDWGKYSYGAPEDPDHGPCDVADRPTNMTYDTSCNPIMDASPPDTEL